MESVYPVSMEKLDQGYGYILYESQLKDEGPLETLRLWGANDRANIFVDEIPTVTLYDRELLDEIKWEENKPEGQKLSILMENMGRVNFGPNLERQRKGIDGSVQVNGHNHYYWKEYTLPMEHLEHLDFTGWGKGCILVNGFNIGRFWEIGPQKRLYIPGPLLKKGTNTILIFETEGKVPGIITLCDEPDLG